MRDLVRLARPHFLVAGVFLYAFGAALARRDGFALPLVPYLLGQGVVTLAQLGVHFGNEAHDLEADRHNARRTWLSGGSGVLVEGGASRHLALRLSGLCFGGALLAGAAASWQASASAGAIAAAMVLLGWAYSAPPLRLCARGWGELAAGLVVAGLVPALALALAGAGFGPWRLLALAPGVVEVAVAVAVLSLPDAPSDAAAGKRTLVVRLGARASRRVIAAAWLLAAGLGLALLAHRGAPILALPAGMAVALAVGLPVAVARQAWSPLALAAALLVGLQVVAVALA